MTSIGALVVAVAMALGPWAHLFGFSNLPLPLLGVIAAIALAYLLVAEMAKRSALSTWSFRKAAARTDVEH
jgi:Mg2+-importing ATPase